MSPACCSIQRGEWQQRLRHSISRQAALSEVTRQIAEPWQKRGAVGQEVKNPRGRGVQGGQGVVLMATAQLTSWSPICHPSATQDQAFWRRAARLSPRQGGKGSQRHANECSKMGTSGRAVAAPNKPRTSKLKQTSASDLGVIHASVFSCHLFFSNVTLSFLHTLLVLQLDFPSFSLIMRFSCLFI